MPDLELLTSVLQAPPRTPLQSALEEWRQALGTENVLEAAASERYGPNTAAIRREIPAAVRPRNAADIVIIVRIAAKHRIPLYPISTGKNWGYGCANPVQDGCALV